MTKSSLFSLTRFKHQLLLDIYKERNLFFLLMGLGITISLVIFFYTIGTSDRMVFRDNTNTQSWFLTHLVSAFIFSGSAFSTLRNRASATGYLMLPTTTLEKFIGVIVLSIAYSLSYVIATYLTLYCAVWSCNTFLDGIYFMIDQPRKLMTLLWVILTLQAIALFGAVSFKKLPAVKTAACIAAFIFIVGMINQYLEGVINFYPETIWQTIALFMFINLFPIIICTTPLFVLLAFLRLKEKEV